MTVIETTAWSDGSPAEPSRPVAVASGGASEPPAAPPVVPPAVASASADIPRDPDASSLVWVGLGGVGMMLAAAVAVVRTLRR